MNTGWFIFKAILILFLSPSAVAVSVTTQNAHVEVHENADAVLSCEIKTEKDTNPRIEWKKRSKGVSLIYYNKEFKEDFSGRAEIKGATIILRKVTYKDAGVYHCEVTAPLDKVKLGEINVTLKVLVAPSTPICEIPSSVLSGTKVELLCKDKHGMPPATYKWYRDKKPLSPTGLPNITYTIDAHAGVLRFKAVSQANAGQYHCEASNGVGKPKSCEGKQMKIHDLNMPLIAGAAVSAILVLCLCGLGICCTHRKGCCRKHQTEHRNIQHSQTPQDTQHFKHTRSFVL